MSEDSEDDNSTYSIKSAKEDFRLCGQKIAEMLKEGQEISDEVYV